MTGFVFGGEWIRFTGMEPIFAAAPAYDHNAPPAYSVSEIANALKRTVEDNFGYVRVRGEVSGLKVAASGHAYLALKDADAVLDAVCWKGTMGKLNFRLEDGMEVIGTGKLTTYPGRSKYQIVLTNIEIAGEGALMAMLAARRAKLQAEGLFDAARKRTLPFLPQTIGIVTSPTGAVIRDILHRLEDRWPVRVLLWPVLVQGEQAAGQVAEAIRGFNDMDVKPDLLIVARGGGSIEDLWAFNEEIVVRAAAESRIPLISAVGHETDTTLIDFASDHRAPTPSAAAERAVPVRSEWRLSLGESGNRLYGAITRQWQRKADHLRAAMRGLPRREQLFELREQKLDDLEGRLRAAPWRLLERREQRLALAARGLNIGSHVTLSERRLLHLAERLPQAMPRQLERRDQRLALAARGLHLEPLRRDLARRLDHLGHLQRRAAQIVDHTMALEGSRLQQLGALLESFNPSNVLKRGYALVRDAQGHVVTRAGALAPGQALNLTLAEGVAEVKVTRAGLL